MAKATTGKKKRNKKKSDSQQPHRTEETKLSSTGDNQKTGSKKPHKTSWANVPTTANTTSKDDKDFPTLGSTKDTPTDRGKASGSGRCEPKPPPGFERKVRPPPGFKPI